MYAQQLRTPITLQAQASTQSSTGQVVGGWDDVAQIWADFRTQSGLETVKAGAESALTRASARIRWRADVTTAMRVLMGGQAWRITAVLPDVNLRRHVDLTLEMDQ